MIALTTELSGNRRLEQLYEISKLFASFDVAKHTLDAALKVIADKLPLESAILIEAVIGGQTDMVVWPCEGSDPARLTSAKSHAAGAYAYLVGAPSFTALDADTELREQLGPTPLPAPLRGGGVPDDARRFIVLPLVVGGGAVFGALQLEGASPLDRSDLEFVNAIANQLAIALDRNRAWRYDVLRRREAQRLEAKYETLVDHLDYAFVWEANAETRQVTYVSAQFERMLGFRRQWCLDELDWWSAHVHPDDREQLLSTFERAVAEPGNKRCEHRCVASDGSLRWLRTSIHLVGAGGEPPVLQGVSFDITAARAAQEQVHEQLAFMRTMASTLAEGTLAFDLDHQITFINDAGAALLGCSPGETLGKRSASVVRIETVDGAAVESPLAVAIHSGRVRSEDHMIIRADRRRFPASYTATAIRRDGKVTGAVLTFDDISERKHAEHTEHFLLGAGTLLNASLESAAAASAAAAVGVPRLGDVCLLDLVSTDDHLLYATAAHVDPAAQRDLARSLGAVPRLPVFAAAAAEVVATGRAIQLAIVSDAACSAADLPILRALGIHSALIVPLTLGVRRLGALTFCMTGEHRHRDGDLALAEELARRCALAIEHARLYEQARHAVAMREQTLAIVSHDLRSPLATIVMAASILGSDELTRTSPPSSIVVAEKIQKAAARMERMIEDLLDFASIEAGRLSMTARPHAVAAIIEQVIADFDATAIRHQVTLTGGAAADVPAIQCDRDRILQVIANLVGNALRILKPGGSVALHATLGDREAVFSVVDNGPGIAIADQKRLFDRYWRSPDAGYKGHGLGLAIARGLVEAHRGRIWVESEPGRGATFCFTVPLAESPPGRPEPLDPLRTQRR
ncbi:MAG TPA: ATP-binding protein [Kofleriaceae bacterium]